MFFKHSFKVKEVPNLKHLYSIIICSLINLFIYLNTHKEGINDLIAKMKKGPMESKGLVSIKYSVQDT